jgi:hypothetical protein
MRTICALLSTLLALGTVPALAADHDHESTPSAAGSTKSASDDAGGFKMMMKKKGGNAAKGAGASSDKPCMCARMAERRSAMHGPVL